MSHQPILLIRHAEKPDAARGIHGVDENGHHDPRSLSVHGWQRAGALAVLFGRAGAVTPAALYATAPRPPSRRPQQTLAPLAAALNQPLQLHAATDTLLAALAHGNGPALVCWRHDDLPAIATALCGGLGVPLAWPDDRFDLVWYLEHAEGGLHFRQSPQQLLAGDRSEPIT